MEVVAITILLTAQFTNVVTHLKRVQGGGNPSGEAAAVAVAAEVEAVTDFAKAIGTAQRAVPIILLVVKLVSNVMLLKRIVRKVDLGTTVVVEVVEAGA